MPRGPKHEVRITAFTTWLHRKILDGGLDPATIAKRAGIHPSYLSLIKNGRRTPTPDVVARLAVALGTEAAELDHLLKPADPPVPFQSGDLNTIAAIAQLPSTTRQVVPLLCQILSNLPRLITFDYAHITRVDEDRGELEMLACKEPGKDPAPQSAIMMSRWPLTMGITGWVATTGKPLRVGDVTKDHRFFAHWKTMSELAVPLIADRVIGVINLESEHPDHFTERDEQLLTIASATVGSAVQRALEEKRETDWHNRFTGLAELHRTVAGGSEMGPALQLLTERTASLFPEVDACVIRLHDKEKDLLPLVAAATRDAKQQASLSVALDALVPVRASISGLAIQKKQLVLTDDVQRDPRFYRGHVATARSFHAMAVVPILPPTPDGEPLGSLAVYSTRAESPFERAYGRLLDDLARFIGVVLTNFDQSRRLDLQHAVLNATTDGARQRGALNKVCEIAARYTDAGGAVLYLTDGAALRRRGDHGEIPSGFDTDYPFLDSNWPGHVGLAGRTIRIADPTSTEEIAPHRLVVERPGSSLLAVPIRANDNRVVGVLCPVAKRHATGFTHVDQTVVEEIATHLGQAMAAEDKRQERFDTLAQQVLEPINAIEEITRTWTARQANPDDQLLADIRTISMHCAWAMRSLAEVRARPAVPDTPRLQPEPLYAIVAEALDEHRAMADHRRIKLEADDKDLKAFVVNADRALLKQAFSNLIENAVRYSEKGSTVRVVLYGNDGVSCTVCIQNRGLHIPAEESEEIFDAGFRGAKAREYSPGCGIGLTTARAILEQHQGDIWMKSIEAGDGSEWAAVRFYVETPLAQRLGD